MKRHRVQGAGRRALLVAVVVLILLSPAWAGCLKKKPHALPPEGRSGWAFNFTQIQAMNDIGLTGRGVVVALVDSGIDLTHPEFSGLLLAGWKDLVNGGERPYDDDGHGTQMAGIIAGREGGAPNASLLVIKAISHDGKSTDSRVAGAVRFALDPNGDGDRSDAADLISLSLGGGRIPILGTETERAVKEALTWGTFVVAAADNDGESDDGDVASPASVRLVIAAGAVDRDGNIASFSSRGVNGGSLLPPVLPRSDPNKKPELTAPGADIWCPVPGGGYSFGSGTSHSAAFVSCALTLLLGALPRYQPESNEGETTIVKFKQVFMETALKLDGQSDPHDDHYGYGLVQTFAAYQALSG